jgi:hypothetical protein
MDQKQLILLSYTKLYPDRFKISKRQMRIYEYRITNIRNFCKKDFIIGDLVDFKIYKLEEGLHQMYNPFIIEEIHYMMPPGATKGYYLYTINNGAKRFEVESDEICISLSQIRASKLKELGI